MKIREEVPADRDAIFAINEAAFGADAEAKLVNQLRVRASFFKSLVADEDEKLVGHIAFSMMEMHACWTELALGLAPLAVHPTYQRRGIGSKLVIAGIEACKGLHAAAIFVFGETDYYSRFGFKPAIHFRILLGADGPNDHFMALELKPNALVGAQGRVKYHPAFDEFF